MAILSRVLCLIVSPISEKLHEFLSCMLFEKGVEVIHAVKR